MIPSILAQTIEHLWQSTLFVGAAWLLTLALRKNRAHVRYWVWFTASVKFLVPFSFLVGLGALVPRQEAVPAVQTEWLTVMGQISQPLTLPAVAARAAVTADAGNENYFALTALVLWTCGFTVVAIGWLVRWRRVLALRRSAARVSIPAAAPVMSSPGLLEPGVVGIFHPVLLLPQGIGERLSAAQLDAILAHELCHVRRKDNLTAAIHMAVQAIFWFHPLVWWLGARLVDERERACDEEVVRLGSQPQVYAEGILNVCKLYVESPMACVAGVTGSNLKRRIEAIMKNRSILRLNFAKKAALAVAGMAALALPAIVGVMHTPAVLAQTAAAARPRFEVASIKLNKDCGSLPITGGASPAGRLNLQCMTVSSFIQGAYVSMADGLRMSPERAQIEGAPAWVDSDLYDIYAQAEGNPTQTMMRGPMLQTLLEERFNLKIRVETREIPVYALTVAPGGPKLQPFKEGTCVPLDVNTAAPRTESQTAYCRTVFGRRSASVDNVTVEAHGLTLEKFANLLGLSLDRPVIDNTGIAGTFDFHLEFAPDQMTPRFFRSGAATGAPGLIPADLAGGPSISTAIREQLGLKLEAAKGPCEFVVIDHVERPSEN